MLSYAEMEVMMTGLLLLSLLGCDLFQKAGDKVSGVLNPTVGQGVILSVAPPDDPTLDEIASGGALELGTTVTLFLADAKSVTDLENAPIADATVTLDHRDGAAQADPQGGGAYVIGPAKGLNYAPNDTWTITVDRPGAKNLSLIAMTLPPVAVADVPSQHSVNTPLVIDLSGQPFNSALIIVLDGQGGVTWSNEPQSIKEVYDFTRSTSTVGPVEIPASAFPDASIYAVGVAGMVNTNADDLTSMNTALSSMMAGQLKLYPTSTLTAADL